MSAEVFRTAEMEETARVMAHISDLNLTVAERVLVGTNHDGSLLRATQRLQQLPFVLVDFRLADEVFWRGCLAGEISTDSSALDPVLDSQIARHLLHVAWHCGRASAGPRLLLGITREVGELVATLRFAELDALAHRYAKQVRRRWLGVPGFWSQLLRVALDADEAGWSRFQLHTLRLLGRE